MRRTSPHFRLLVLVLTMHLAHVPVPMWDAGDGLERSCSPNVCGRIVGLRWDLDPLLLGIDPPENLDEGPVDSDPEIPQAEFCSPDRVASRAGRLQRGESDPFETLIAPADRSNEVISSTEQLPALRLTCYSASFAGSHPWSIMLGVMTV